MYYLYEITPGRINYIEANADFQLLKDTATRLLDDVNAKARHIKFTITDAQGNVIRRINP